MPTFDGEELIITLDPVVNGVLTVDVAAVYADWKTWARSGNMRYPEAFRTVGGDALTTLINAGGYFFLRNDYGWRYRPFENDGDYFFVGNAVAQDSTLRMTAPTIGNFNTSILGIQPITQSVAPVVAEVKDLKYLVESTRPHHTGGGTVWYWDPIGGLDTNSGEEAAKAFKTFAAAHDAAADGGHDIIVALADTAAGQTITTETIEITKRYLFLRGPGRDFRFKPTVTNVPTISINAEGVEISGVVVDTAATGGQSAIEVQDAADFFFIDHVWSRDAQHAAVKVLGSTVYGRIDGCFFSHTADESIHVDGDTRHLKITNTECDSPTESGIRIEGTTARNNIIGDGVKVYNSTNGYGIRIDSPATRNLISRNVALYDNALGPILDNGILTEDEYTTNAGGFSRVLDIHEIMGLNATNPVTVTPTSRVAGTISQVISGDGETTTTVTRS